VWIAGVIPLRTRAMMLSTFMDKPFLGWLTGTVYQAIRVSEEGGFRRHIPELDVAVKTLEAGESVMVFPEAWIRRKEEQPMRRFAQGVVKILQRRPQTPVIACWVEDGWGSFSSYKNGPPFKGKPFDILKRIRIGVSNAEILPPELVADEKALRRHLMQMVLNARTYLGMPAYPTPGGGE
jgi:1-acyl-sn-glycerol-3-phosphate acyltransferase